MKGCLALEGALYELAWEIAPDGSTLSKDPRVLELASHTRGCAGCAGEITLLRGMLKTITLPSIEHDANELDALAALPRGTWAAWRRNEKRRGLFGRVGAGILAGAAAALVALAPAALRHAPDRAEAEAVVAASHVGSAQVALRDLGGIPDLDGELQIEASQAIDSWGLGAGSEIDALLTDSEE